jgi:hypothetical protein
LHRFEKLHRLALRIPEANFRYIGIDDEGDTSASYAGEVSRQEVQSEMLTDLAGEILFDSLRTDTNHSLKISTVVSPLYPSRRALETPLRDTTLTTPLVQK